jgi:hypothetical protein
VSPLNRGATLGRLTTRCSGLASLAAERMGWAALATSGLCRRSWKPIQAADRLNGEVRTPRSSTNHGSRGSDVLNGRRRSPGRELTILGRSGAISCRRAPSPAKARFSDRAARLVMAALQGREITIFQSGPVRLVMALSTAPRSRFGIGAAQQVVAVLSRRSITKSILRVARNLIPVTRATFSV